MCFTLGFDTNFSTIITRIQKVALWTTLESLTIFFEKVITNAVYHFANENT